MQTVLIVIHLMVVIALVAVVLLQRSEGGALGVGGGSGFMTGRGQANVLTRATAILATIFFLTSLGLTVLANYSRSNKSILEGAPSGTAQPAPTLPPKGQGSVLDQLRAIEQQRGGSAGAPQTPPAATTQTPPAAAPAPTTTPKPQATAPAEPAGVPDKPADAVTGKAPAVPAGK